MLYWTKPPRLLSVSSREESVTNVVSTPTSGIPEESPPAVISNPVARLNAYLESDESENDQDMSSAGSTSDDGEESSNQSGLLDDDDDPLLSALQSSTLVLVEPSVIPDEKNCCSVSSPCSWGICQSSCSWN